MNDNSALQSCWQSIHTLSVGDISATALPVIAECAAPGMADELSHMPNIQALWEGTFRELLFASGAPDELSLVAFPILFMGIVPTKTMPQLATPDVRYLGLITTQQTRIEPFGINNVALPAEQLYYHDGVRFRSPAEPPIYDALKKRQVLFFPNPLAVLGGKMLKREPDFLICDTGRWGLLEVMGEAYHPSAAHDHERARLFKDYGLVIVEFYAAKQCMQHPDGVVDDFLRRLAAVGR